MSNSTKWPLVNKAEDTVTLNLSGICKPAAAPTRAPIDEYYSRVTELVGRSAKSEIAGDETLLRLLLLEVFSSAELYFRRVLSQVVNVCPLARKHAASRNLSFGSVAYYDRDALGFALFETQSMAGAGEVRRLTEAVVGVSIPTTSSLAAALQAFEQVCHIRHASTHACGELGARNAFELGLEVTGVHSITMSIIQFQTIVAVVHNAVRAYNSFLFTTLLGRWKAQRYLTGKWGSDGKPFTRLYEMFYSVNDAAGTTNPRDAYDGIAALFSAF